MKLITEQQAAALLKSGDTVAVSGSGACNLVPEKLLEAIEERYLREALPQALTLFHPQGIGNKAQGGLARLAHKGLCRRVIGGHWGMSPAMGRLALEEALEAYNFPQGVLAQQLRDMAAGGPGVLTKIGLNTYIDPRVGGGRMNRSAQEELVELVELGGEEWLHYKPVPIDVALIRGTTADEDGYISCEQEVHYDEVLAMAAAARHNGGIVIVQVKQLAKRGTLQCAETKIPGYLVDYVVLDPAQRQTLLKEYDPAYSGKVQQSPLFFAAAPLPLDERKAIARRQTLALSPGMLVNIGVGVSNGVPLILREDGLLDKISFSLEQGQSGGMPVMGLDAGTMVSPRIILDHPAQHDLYHGGVLDATCLSAAEIDFYGNVNVSKLGDSLTGCGGFLDIAQETKRIVFGGTFCAKSKASFQDGRVTILEQGTIKKFVRRVQQVSFSGDYAVKTGKQVLFVTERCVFELTENGLLLTEIAPGIDLERDILAQMEFMPLIAPQPKIMPAMLYSSGPMHLKTCWEEPEHE